MLGFRWVVSEQHGGGCGGERERGEGGGRDVMVFSGGGGGERRSDWRGCFTFSAVSCVCEVEEGNRLLLKHCGGGEVGERERERVRRDVTSERERSLTSRHVEFSTQRPLTGF